MLGVDSQDRRHAHTSKAILPTLSTVGFCLYSSSRLTGVFTFAVVMLIILTRTIPMRSFVCRSFLLQFLRDLLFAQTRLNLPPSTAKASARRTGLSALGIILYGLPTFWAQGLQVFRVQD